MRVLCSGDLHINDWSEFSTRDNYGRQSRLLDYLKLADTMIDLAKAEKCDAIILAGDISEKSLQLPHVLDVIGDFLRKLGKQFPVHIIHGQHDISSKSTEINHKNSILTEICKDLEGHGIYYYPETSKIEINGYSVVFQSWTGEHYIPDIKADVFVGHGIVKGCTNLDGYIFINGFDKEDLFSNFKASIISDIHKKQSHWSEDGKSVILQPGAPIQNTWKDSEDCGLWVMDISEDTGISLSFSNIHKLSPDTFHTFTYDSESSNLVHSRPRIKLQSKKKTKSNKIEVKRDLNVIRETCLSLIQNKKTLVPLIEEVFGNTSLASTTVIAQSKIQSVTANNFLSIGEFSLDFDEFPESCVVVGKNGHGKSTISEAIYWCLTGNTTKGVATDSLVNIFSDNDSCSVSLGITINNEEYTIIRQRNGNTGSLKMINKEGIPFQRGSMRETQQEIYSILGLKEWQVFMFSYFSAENTPIFNDLGNSSKNDLISQIVGLDFVESMREYSKSKKTEFKNLKVKMSGVLEEKASLIKNNKIKLDKLKEEAGTRLPEIEKRINTLSTSLVNKSNEYKLLTEEVEALCSKVKVETLDQVNEKIANAYKQYHANQSSLETISKNRILLTSNLKKLEGDLEKASTGNCPTCGQETCDDKILELLQKDRDKIISEIDSIGDIDKLTEKLDRMESTINKLEKLRKAILSKTSTLFAIKEEISDTKVEISSLENSMSQNNDAALISHLEEEITSLLNEEQESTELWSSYKDLEEDWKFLETSLFKRNGDLSKELNKQGSVLLQACIDELTSNLPISFRIDSELKLVGKFHNNTTVDYSNMSSGQRRLTNILMMVVLNNLFSKIYNLENGVLGLAVYDEILSFLDDEYIQVAKQLIDQSRSRKLLIITHDYGLMNMYDSRINVKMGKSGSEYKKSWI